MKTVRLMLTVAMLAVAGVASANIFEPQPDEVVVGEQVPGAAAQGYPNPTVESYGVMPSWTTRLSEAEIRAVSAYVHQLGGGE